MNYSEALQYITSTSWQGSRLGLERTRELLKRLGDPQDKLRFVHIAGTNGKGSTAAMVASVLTSAGYCTGLNTSPSLYRFNERMQVNGTPITDEEVAQLTLQLRTAAEGMEAPPTEFELVTALSFLYFAYRKCDIVVLEVGMGGRLDSTNVVRTTEVAVITTIGLDHTEMLGDTVEKIAQEKAGIIKPGCAVVVSGQQQSVLDVVAKVASEAAAEMTVADPEELHYLQGDITGQQFDYRQLKHLRLPLVGAHQRLNAATALATVKALQVKGWNITEESIRQGLAATVWPGRFELLSTEPVFIVDGGHNPQCAETVAATLRELYGEKKIIFLMGLLADKDFNGVVDAVAPLAKCFYTVQPGSPRALTAEQLRAKLSAAYPGIPAESCGSVTQGIAAAKAAAGADDVICAFGSLYMLGEIRHEMGR
ncbi:bifunctional folylpolyglutamate synthase/dihydrofolate synthase [Pygmaiobacter massiliensis]|uniref:bifunctional folylpolyglutamate synthase/dihydrofolate synthase n=1 Tax=Pygmaiobacter massiliensis TaxID=1917873 RepID=UPI000C7E553A|nr:folylpolyglutamate synthase/dihydrofolate synthase family protein [Pygmaiobacter massiliensis]